MGLEARVGEAQVALQVVARSPADDPRLIPEPADHPDDIVHNRCHVGRIVKRGPVLLRECQRQPDNHPESLLMGLLDRDSSAAHLHRISGGLHLQEQCVQPERRHVWYVA